MLKITIPPVEEYYDESTERFYSFKGQSLQLEHSLVSLSKWEQKWHKPFISKEDKTTEETISYIECMTLTQNVDPIAYKFLTDENIKEVLDYIKDPMTATWFGKSDKPKKSNEVITNEVIYAAMVDLQIPVEFQKWHLNRLTTLIRVLEDRHNPKEKPKGNAMYARRNALNEARKAKYKSRG